MQKPNENKSEFLMTTDVAREAEVAGQTVILWERTKKLPALRTANGTRLFRRIDVDRFLRERAAKKAARAS
jgi:DNA-binding transcriptional MerR regulator